VSSEVVTATTQEHGEIVAVRPPPAPATPAGLYLRRVHDDGTTTDVRLDDPGMQVVLRTAVVSGSHRNRQVGVSYGRAGHITQSVMAALRSVTEKEPPG